MPPAKYRHTPQSTKLMMFSYVGFVRIRFCQASDNSQEGGHIGCDEFEGRGNLMEKRCTTQ